MILNMCILMKNTCTRSNMFLSLKKKKKGII